MTVVPTAAPTADPANDFPLADPPPAERWPTVVADEAELLCDLIAPTAATRIVELGCGNAAVVRRLLARGAAAGVVAFEVDAVQHAKNEAAPPLPGLTFAYGGAEDVPLPAAYCDVVLMLKSLHHVPAAKMARALTEAGRLLVPGGVLYVAEPVSAGAYDALVRHFHDEAAVRAAAYAELRRAVGAGVYDWQRQVLYDVPLAFASHADFVDRVVNVTHTSLSLPPDVDAAVRRDYDALADGDGHLRLVRPMRVDVLRKPP